MEQSENIADLAGAMAKAQGAMRPALKDATNPHFKSKYADLASCWDACRDALASNDLALFQTPGPCESGHMTMTTLLAHSSGQWVKDTLSIPLSKVDAQGFGSALTYARRYALSSMVGIAPEEDDGNAATRPSHDAVANHGPAPRTKLEGPHASKTALKAAISAIDTTIRKAVTVEDINKALKAGKATITQAEDVWPELIHGDPEIVEIEGLQNLVIRRRAELTPREEGPLYSGMVTAMKACATAKSLASWMGAEDTQEMIEALDDAERRSFELALALHESGIDQMDTVRA